MGSLKDDWKETGKDLGGAFTERDDAKEAARKEAEVEKAKEEKAANTVICSKCGAEITDPEAVFCLKCGEKLEK